MGLHPRFSVVRFVRYTYRSDWPWSLLIPTQEAATPKPRRNGIVPGLRHQFTFSEISQRREPFRAVLSTGAGTLGSTR